MKLSEHSLLSLRCAMTKLGYQWKCDRRGGYLGPRNRSLRWPDVDHWELWPSADGTEPGFLAMHPVVACSGGLITMDVACTVQIRPDHTLGRWELTESYAGTAIELDARIHRLEDLPEVLSRWVNSWSKVER